MNDERQNKQDHRWRVPFIEQMQQTECGACCLAMVMHYYKSSISMYDLREALGSGRDGTSMYQLKKAAEQFQFTGKCYKSDLSFLETLQLPAIILWDENHYVVLERIKNKNKKNSNEKKYTIIDPAIGRKHLIEESFMRHFHGYVLELIPTVTFERVKAANVWATMFRLIIQNKKMFMLVFLVTAVLQLCAIAMPILIQQLIDKVIMPANTTMMSVMALGIIIMLVTSSIFTYIRGRILITMHNVLDSLLQTNFFQHLLKLPYSFFMLRSFGDLLFRANSLNMIRELISGSIIRGLLDALMLIVLFIYMSIQSTSLALLVVALSLINIIAIVFTKKVIAEWNQRQILAGTNVQSVQTEMLLGIFHIKTSGVEGSMFEKWQQHFMNLLDIYRSKERITNILVTLTSLLQITAPLIILWVGAYRVFDGVISLGILIAIQSIASQFFGVSGSLVGTVNSFILTTSYLKRVQDVLDASIENYDGRKKIELTGKIELENVSYAYSKFSDPILSDISMSIKPGQKVSIIGQSGAGKSTLVNLLIGLFEPTTGHICYDDIYSNNLDMQHVRKQIGTVPQNIYLFNRSILDNIRFSAAEATIEDVMEAAKAAQIHDEIMQMPMKYHTMISEMGMNLSGGQRQRIALAKALLTKPTVLLLDEATSSLDHLNEERIDRYLSDIACTRIVIAHRLTTVMNSDVILVLDQGRISAIGTHEQLLKKSDYYRRYYCDLAVV
ncbi:peptidase C39 [Paenibacillus glucanolyticus]|uniref:Peptidase C39 n=1 Tax=Paenibacillus glucanolyticus TaxID=59843 RepID=A0A163IUT7_9BACL|nr:peptidase domain-containing ABC transporter [Paenibacillus glucanolyticus]KZS46179.1 peptidase C39 [Paenibacillus glucanolyticus]